MSSFVLANVSFACLTDIKREWSCGIRLFASARVKSRSCWSRSSSLGMGFHVTHHCFMSQPSAGAVQPGGHRSMVRELTGIGPAAIPGFSVDNHQVGRYAGFDISISVHGLSAHKTSGASLETRRMSY